MLTTAKTAKTPENIFSYAAATVRVAHQFRRAKPHERLKLLSPAEPRKRLVKELKDAQKLGDTHNGWQIFLLAPGSNSSCLRELGRLRELTFRAVGEGTHKLRDLDRFDESYWHIVLWDSVAEEIVGAYRVAEALHTCKTTVRHQAKRERRLDTSKLYTSELFDYTASFNSILSQGLELGRSFIQPKYWTRHGLDMLWQGIGAYLKTKPNVRYLFGAVSLSNDYPELAKQEIIAFYRHFYQPENAQRYATAKSPFVINRAILESFRSKTLNEARLELRRSLSRQHVTLPTLFKHYAELCDTQGVSFLDFNVDANFSFCIDGLIVTDLRLMKAAKKRRYLTISTADEQTK